MNLARTSRLLVVLSCCTLALTVACEPRTGIAPIPKKTVLRVGHFPNVTHAQALVAHHLSREGKGWFEARLGLDVEIQWFVYNAGPSAMEALFADSIDLTYVGPSPAINAHLKSRGDEVRIIAGAASGGSALVVQKDGGLAEPADFKGKKVATPQLGNTQDVACRAWLLAGGLQVTQTGGDVQVIPSANPDQLALFQRRELDAVWTVEPWVSRLETESGGKLLVEEKEAVTTVLVARAGFLRERRDLAEKFARAHSELTRWLSEHPAEAQQSVRAELKEETTREVPAALIERSWTRLRFVTEVDRASLDSFLVAARKVGFLKETGNLSKLVEVLP